MPPERSGNQRRHFDLNLKSWENLKNLLFPSKLGKMFNYCRKDILTIFKVSVSQDIKFKINLNC